MTEAESASQITEHLDQFGYDRFLEKCRTNLENPASELTKNCSGLIPNNISQHTTLGGTSCVSSNGRSVEDSDKNSDYREIDKEPLREADWQGLLFESSEQKNPIANIDVQTNVSESCTVVSGVSHIKQQKECLHSEDNPAAQSHDHGHDDINDIENIAGESDKRSDDIVPGQLADNCLELSKLKKPDGDIFESPEHIVGEYIKGSNCGYKDKSGPSSQDVTKQSMLEHVEALPDDTSKSINCQYQLVLALQSCPKSYARSNEASSSKAVAELKSSTLYENKTCRSSGLRLRKTPATKVESEYTLRSSTGGKRSSKSFIHKKTAASEPDGNLDNANAGRKRGRRKRYRNRKIHDDFSKMKIHLRYLLHRMRYEENLIDAYSSEGWRGQSLEKLRPEKEIQRAKLDINRSKLKIRVLFQLIDAICAEGKFPEDLFDAEGLIDSEDIFCAKCGSKDLSRDNDIILCDGGCDRGFHQLCLDPPLRTEDIPPGGESWICPACDCKFDCIQLLNDSVGTKISYTDNWEHVFPEAEKTGSTMDDVSGLPLDDSEDDDYNPDEVDDDDDDDDGDDDDMAGHISTSDESYFSSASDDLGDIQKQNNDEQYLGLPSDDSEDDDYNPNSAHIEEQPMKESSSSDFVSASEDLHPDSNNDEFFSKDGCQMSPSQLVQDSDNSLPVSGRRKVERLDYKKLYDETYGNTSTDSSDDEDWKYALTPKRRKNGRRNISSELSGGEEWVDAVKSKRRRYGARNSSSPNASNDFPVSADGTSNVVGDTSTTRKASHTPEIGVSDISQTPKTSSGGKRQPYKRLGENVTQRLYASFKENQYPDRITKENLAAELGVSVKQVDKWFGNARWSFNHHSAVPDSGVASRGVDMAPNVGESSGTKTLN